MDGMCMGSERRLFGGQGGNSAAVDSVLKKRRAGVAELHARLPVRRGRRGGRVCVAHGLCTKLCNARVLGSCANGVFVVDAK